MNHRYFISVTFLLTLCGLWTCPATAQIFSKRFPNGTTLLLSPGGGTNLAGIFILVKGGSRFESEEERGTFGLIPPILKRGTVGRTPYEITREISILGDSFDFSTTTEYWSIAATVPSERLNEAFELTQDLLVNPLFPEDGLAKEKNIAIQTIKSRQDFPLSRLIELYNSVFYPDFYSPEEERIAHIQNISRQELIGVHREFFGPENIVISVAGSFDVKHTRGVLERTFGKLPKSRGTLEREPPIQSSDALPLLREVKGGLTQSGVLIGTRLEGFQRKDESVLTLFGAVLRNSIGGILFEEIRERQGLVYDIDVYHSLRITPYTWFVFGTSRKRNVKRVIRETERILRGLKEQPLDDEELKLAREYCKTRLAITYQSPRFQAEYIAVQAARKERILGFEERLAEIDAVSGEELTAFVRNYFPDDWTVLVVR